MFAQVVGRHAACNLAAFGCLAGPGGRWQPVVANAGTLPLSCGGVAGWSECLWQFQLLRSAPAGALSMSQSFLSSGYLHGQSVLVLQVFWAKSLHENLRPLAGCWCEYSRTHTITCYSVYSRR